MRVYKPIILYLPDLLVKELDKYLIKHPPSFKFQVVYFYFVIHYLTKMQIQYKKDEYFFLNRDYLKTITASNIDRYIKILRAGEFILSDNIYTPGVKRLKYKINEKFIKGLTTLELKQDSKLSKNIINQCYRGKSHYSRLKPYLRAMSNELMKVELDYEKAIKWVETNANDNQKLSYLTSINHIKDKRFRYFKRNKTNKRLDTNFTNLKSDLRQFIIGDYVSIDLKNSQPFLLSVLIDNIINNKDTLCCYLAKKYIVKAFGIKRIKQVLLIRQNQEKHKMAKLSLYNTLVQKGLLYDNLVKDFELSRKETKDILLVVFFSRNECETKSGYTITPYKKDKEVFASVFPFVYEIIKALKDKDHRTLPIYLQRLESYLFIDCIAKELVDNGIIPFTIHDSVIVKAEHQAKTIEIMNGVFKKKIGVIPSFEVK